MKNKLMNSDAFQYLPPDLTELAHLRRFKKIQALLDSAVIKITTKHSGESRAQARELIRDGFVFPLKHKCFVASAFL